MDEFVSKFEALFDNHKDALVESAHGHDETIWINLCKITASRTRIEAR